jgi:hypothetical protein
MRYQLGAFFLLMRIEGCFSFGSIELANVRILEGLILVLSIEIRMSSKVATLNIT